MRDFDAQIASTAFVCCNTIYLSVINRFHDYETIGVLFRASHKDAIKLIRSQQILLIIKELMSELS